MLSSQELAVVLRNNGYKVTPQRLAVYEVMVSNPCHPTAETIFQQLQYKFPSMSFATVYKTVEILHRLNLIQVLSLGEDSLRYDADVSVHHHLQCTCCSRVYDLKLDTQSLVAQAEQNSGYNIHSQRLYFFGICPECRKRNLN